MTHLLGLFVELYSRYVSHPYVNIGTGKIMKIKEGSLSYLGVGHFLRYDHVLCSSVSVVRAM